MALWAQMLYIQVGRTIAAVSRAYCRTARRCAFDTVSESVCHSSRSRCELPNPVDQNRHNQQA